MKRVRLHGFMALGHNELSLRGMGILLLAYG